MKSGLVMRCAWIHFAFLFSLHVFAADTITRETISTSALRVCADPANLPFSNDKLEGFENQIIALIAGELDLPVQYTWFPQTVGYIRNTLGVHECDLVSGISTGSERLQNTNPYYRSVYTLVYASDEGEFPDMLSDDFYRDKRIGVVAGTPAASMMARYGLLANMQPYPLTVDTRHDSSGWKAVSDVDMDVTDAAIIWGPLAGYFSLQASRELSLLPLIEESRNFPLDFRISMGVRFNDQQLKLKINDALEKLEPEINEILAEYKVPLLDNQGRLIKVE